jgi:hypothetical protein
MIYQSDHAVILIFLEIPTHHVEESWTKEGICEDLI